MYQATIYIENIDGKIEKLTHSFDTREERNLWLMSKLESLDFSYFIVNGEPFSVNTSHI